MPVLTHAPRRFNPNTSDFLFHPGNVVYGLRQGLFTALRTGLATGSHILGPRGEYWHNAAAQTSALNLADAFPGYPWGYGDSTGQRTLTTITVTANLNASCLSPNGKWLATGSGTTPFLQLWDASTGTAFANPGTLPPAAVTDVRWTVDSRYVVITHGNTPFFSVYEVSQPTLGALPTLTKLTNPGTLPGATGGSCAISMPILDRYWIVVTSKTAGGLPQQWVYTLQGTTITFIQTNVLSAVANLSIEGGGAWSPDGRFYVNLYDNGTNSSALVVWQITASNVLTFTGQFITFAANVGSNAAGRSVEWAADGRHVMTGATPVSPFVVVCYIHHDSSISQYAAPGTLPSGQQAMTTTVEERPNGFYRRNRAAGPVVQ